MQINLVDRHFKIVCSQKVIRSLTGIAVHICQIKRKSAGNFFLKCANKYFLVSGPSNWRVDNMGIKMSTKIPWCYLMAMWSMRKQKFIDRGGSAIMQDFRDNKKKKIIWPTGGHFVFYNCEVCHGLSLCETIHFVLYSWPSYFAFFLSLSKYHKIIKI